MAKIDDIRKLVMDKDFNFVRRELGNPDLVTSWDSQEPPLTGDRKEIDRFRDVSLHRIWVYVDAVLSFNFNGIVKEVTDDAADYLPDPSGDDEDDDEDSTAKKLTPLIGRAEPQAWEALDPIPERKPGCTNLGVVLFIHDVEPKRVEYAKRSDANLWVAVHTITDLIEALRNLVDHDKCVSGIMTSSHGGYGNRGGFRMGDDTDGDGKIEQGEAQDRVSNAAQARRFGEIINGAFCDPREAHPVFTLPILGKLLKVPANGVMLPESEYMEQRPKEPPYCVPVAKLRKGFISVESCDSCGPGLQFLRALHGATDLTVMGSVGSANVGGNRRKGGWWKAKKGRTQMNADMSISHNGTKRGKGIWTPF